MDRPSTVTVAFCLLLAAAPIAALAQEARATLGGRVTDTQGAAGAHAIVDIVSEETGVERHVRTNAEGNWTSAFLLPGHYRFLVTQDGFKTAERRGIELQTSDVKLIDTMLELGSMNQSIEVSGEAPLIDTTSATSGT